MGAPIEVDIPHQLGREGARARLAGGIHKIGDMFPGGGTVSHHWEGDSLHFTVSAMGQQIASRLDVAEDKVHATVDLPPFLALFANAIRQKLSEEGPKLLK